MILQSSQSPLKKLFGLRKSRQRKHITPVGFQLRNIPICECVYPSPSFLVVLVSLIRLTVRSLWRKMSGSGWNGTWRRHPEGLKWLIRTSVDLLTSWMLLRTTTLNLVVCYKDLWMKVHLRTHNFQQLNNVTEWDTDRHWKQKPDSFIPE